LCIDRSAADNLAHDRIAGETVVGMEMPMIDPGCDERVPLEIDRLAVIGR
jgi:hypothetical protein